MKSAYVCTRYIRQLYELRPKSRGRHSKRKTKRNKSKSPLTQTGQKGGKSKTERKRIRKGTCKSRLADSQTRRQPGSGESGGPNKNKTKQKKDNPPTGGVSYEYARAYKLGKNKSKNNPPPYVDLTKPFHYATLSYVTVRFGAVLPNRVGLYGTVGFRNTGVSYGAD